MAFENYQIWSWTIYLLSALVVMLVTLRLIRRWPLTLRGFVMTTAAALFIVPWYVAGSAGPMAPAVIITFFEFIAGDSEGAWMRAGLPLIGGLALGYLLLALFLWWRAREIPADESAGDAAQKEITG